MDKEKLDWLIAKTNRSLNQTKFLFELLGGDFDKLVLLETQIKNCHVAYCPADMECVEYVLNLKPKSNWFTLDAPNN